MKKIILFILVCFFSANLFGQKIKDGTYKFKVYFAEWDSLTENTVTVKIKGDFVFVINDGSLSGKKGEIIDKGILRKHLKTKQWIITHNKKDIYSKEIGGCSDGPIVLDLIKKIIYLC